MRFLIIVSMVFCLLLCVAGLASATEFPGPDDFGYTAQSIPFNLRDVSTSGTQVTLRDDQVSDAIPLGFTFNFYGRDYTEVFISSNGFLTFTPETNNGCCEGNPLPLPDDINNVIAGFWQDLNPSAGGNIRYETTPGPAGSREFVVGFYDVPHFDGPPVTFEIILHEGSNRIELQYASAPTDHTTGIENAEGTIGLQILVGFLNQGFLFDLHPKIEVPINIAPLSCPNNYLRVNPCSGFSHRWLRVAVVGGEIDVTTIVHSTITLEGVSPIYSRVKNIPMIERKTQTSSKSGREFQYCSFTQPDEDADLLMVFKVSEIVEALESNLGRKLVPGEPLVLTLTGNLDGGNEIVGEDLVIIKKQRRRWHNH